jgi:hypothetical protein
MYKHTYKSIFVIALIKQILRLFTEMLLRKLKHIKLHRKFQIVVELVPKHSIIIKLKSLQRKHESVG